MALQRVDLTGVALSNSHPTKWSTNAIPGSSVSLTGFPSGTAIAQAVTAPFAIPPFGTPLTGELHVVVSGLSGAVQLAWFAVLGGTLHYQFAAIQDGAGIIAPPNLLVAGENIIPFTAWYLDPAAPALGIEIISYQTGSTITITDLWLLVDVTITAALRDARGGTLGADPALITGSAFGAPHTFDPDTTVTYGGTAVTAITITPGGLQCLTPPHDVGPVDVVVTEPGETPITLANAYTYATTVSTPGPHAGGPLTAQGPLPSTVQTDASVTRGLNNGTLTYAWSADPSNPGACTITSPSTLNTGVTFDAYVPGTYRVGLTVTDQGGVFNATDVLTVVVPAPTPPTISLGALGANRAVGPVA